MTFPASNQPISESPVISPEISTPQQPSTPPNGSYMGRLIRWLNNTPGGQFTKGVGNILLSAGAVLGSLVLIKAALVTAVFAAALFMSVVGIPFGLLTLPAVYVLLDVSAKVFHMTPVFWQTAMQNFNNMEQLSAQGV